MRQFGDKSRNSLRTNKPLNFSGPCGRVRPAKLANPSARTNYTIKWDIDYNTVLKSNACDLHLFVIR